MYQDLYTTGKGDKTITQEIVREIRKKKRSEKVYQTMEEWRWRGSKKNMMIILKNIRPMESPS
jgi:hypothetical protein